VQVRTALIRRNITGEEEWYPSHLYGTTTTFSGGVVWGF